jgi:hypothetical protein
MENQANILHSKFKIFRAVPFNTIYGIGRSYHKIQREGHLLPIHSEKIRDLE